MFDKLNKNIRNNKQKVLTLTTIVLIFMGSIIVFFNNPNVVYANPVTFDCAAGEYSRGQGRCESCPTGYYCPGGTFYGGDSSRSGIYECPSGTTSEKGSDSESDCVKVTTMTACYDPELLRVVYFFNLLIDIVKIIVPIGLIVFGLIDFSKAVISSDEKNQKKTVGLFVKRILYGVLIFAVPWIVEVLMITLGDLLDKDNMGNFTDCLENADSECIEALDSKNMDTIKSVCDVPVGFRIEKDD